MVLDIYQDMILLLLPWTVALGCTLLLLITLPSVRHKLLEVVVMSRLVVVVAALYLLCQRLVYLYICLWYVCRRLKKFLGLGRARDNNNHVGGPDAMLLGPPRPL